MKSTELVYALREKLLKKALENYSLTFSEKYDDSPDDYVCAIKIFQALNEEERKHIFYLLNVVISDTVADFLGWLDGQSYFESQSSNPVLKFEKDKKNINGYLQDIWFSLENGMSKEELDEEFDN